tara:strand:+ start:460 stop:834 length:375 start_codon:yes stop_codon:yes gene_type:complete
MSNDTIDGWTEWSRHVLAELTRLNDGQDKFQKELEEVRVSIAKLGLLDQQAVSDKLASLTAEMQTVERMINQPDGMVAKDRDFEARLRTIETYQDTLKGKLSVLVFIVSPLLAGLVSLLITYLK